HLDIRLPGQAGYADIGLRRLGDRRQTVDLGVGDRHGRVEHIDIDALGVADPDAVEKNGAAAAEPGRGAGNAYAQLGGFAAVADRRRPVDEGERRHDRDQREDADNDVVGSGFHSYPYSSALRARGKIELARPLAPEIGFNPRLL